MDTEVLEASLLKRLREEGPRLVCAWIFGSHAKGKATETSDLDLALLLAVDPPSTLEGLELGIQEELADILGTPVDLILLNRAPLDLIHEVLRDGRLLLVNDDARRIAFEVTKRREYLDFLPVLQEYRRSGGASGS